MFVWIKRIIFLLLAVSAIVIGITFARENNQLTNLVLFGETLPGLALGLWVMMVLLLGVVIGLSLSILPLFWERRSKNRKIRQLEKELEKIRASHIN
ncbi:MAG: ABC-type dipeptide/oligopeptide/nickel transport system permease component [Cellvibrionaceae bacterium]|jgi:ABC-type dipeptide/oligopeptide/nickel transport system permease component